MPVTHIVTPCCARRLIPAQARALALDLLDQADIVDPEPRRVTVTELQARIAALQVAVGRLDPTVQEPA